MNYDYWQELSVGELMDYYENDHEKGQSFDEWLDDSIRYDFIRVDSDGSYHIRQ